MRLLSCYIENYGKIKRKEYQFSAGMTTIFAENGEGKSTLASFIKAMLFGLKSYKKGSVEFCDREHFYPFEGGKFGGNLTFEREGDIYKIERFFGEKSETLDTLAIYRNGEIFQIEGEIGELVFGVDRDSFERTVFLRSGDLEISSTSSIHARLNRFLEGVEEDGSLDSALAALDKAAKVYKKSKAGNDKVSAETAKLAKLSEEIENADVVKATLEYKYEKLVALEAEIDGLNAQIVSGQEENEKQSQFEHFESLEQRIVRSEKALVSLREKYPLGLPSEEETKAFNATLVGAKELKAKLDGVEFSLSDREKLARISSSFASGAPTEEALLNAEKEMEALTRLETEIRLASEGKRSAREEELFAKFAHKTPSETEMQAARQSVEEYRRMKAENERVYSAAKKPSGKKYGALAVVAVAIMLVGLVGLFVNTVLAVACLVGGGLTLAVDGFPYLNQKSAPAYGEGRSQAQTTELEDGLKALLLLYGYCSGNGVAYDFALLEGDLSAYYALVEERDALSKKLAVNRVKAEEKAAKLTAFFRGYGLAGDTFVKLLSDLRVYQSDYIDLTARKANADENRANLEAELFKAQSQLEGYRRKYGLAEVNVASVLEDISSVLRLTKEIAEGRAQAAAYKAEKGLEARSAWERVDLSALQAELAEKTNERGKLEREIRADEQIAETLDELETEKAVSEELVKEYKRKHKLLTAASETMKYAQGRLMDRYVKPVKDEFLKNAQAIEQALGEKVVVTKDFSLRFERGGVERSEKHLSSGQRSVCALCFRLALFKNMYREQTPFLVLDDPFIYLDEKHMEKVKELLRSLAGDVQTVYFTCHESRRI